MQIKFAIFLILLTVLLLGAVLGYVHEYGHEGIACTLEAKICPDGSFVGRTGPKCEFAPCPKVIDPNVDTSVLHGSVTISPTCPVEKFPPDPNCAPRGYETTVQIYQLPLHTFVDSTLSDENGSFSFTLKPGDYSLEAEGGSVYPRCKTETISLESHTVKSVAISCDSGIR